jgi:hypothetical protein
MAPLAVRSTELVGDPPLWRRFDRETLRGATSAYPKLENTHFGAPLVVSLPRAVRFELVSNIDLVEHKTRPVLGTIERDEIRQRPGDNATPAPHREVSVQAWIETELWSGLAPRTKPDLTDSDRRRKVIKSVRFGDGKDDRVGPEQRFGILQRTAVLQGCETRINHCPSDFLQAKDCRGVPRRRFQDGPITTAEK